ncbi:hybrid sensor histidine kinase/response regulator transcription factor [Carboxylicivirga caseinilyticus]|uniref:hybrid sensor histidine kinase/response regulator transcription factor n=1 Tax=Carboxylicivirga caseinilyticus TaxID=3417572 RepID=UPI003D355EF0|nr:response regulator [Marinilabiliaceae bacterium A049]
MIRVLIILLLSCISVKVLADDIKLEHYSVENGLSHNSVRQIVQDRHGFLWLGTFKGLNSFDGENFTPFIRNYKPYSSIYVNDITTVIVDNDSDQMWIGSRGGLSSYDYKTHQFKNYLPDANDPNSIPDYEIRSLYIDHLKRLWIGTKNEGLCIFIPGEDRFERIDIDGFKYIKSIFEDINGHIWIGSYETGGVARLTLDKRGSIITVKKYNLPIEGSAVQNPYLNFIYQDDKSDMFVGTREGLYKWDKDKDVFYPLPFHDNTVREALGPYFNCITQAPDGKYWLGTIGGLIVCDRLEDISGGKFERHYANVTEKTSLVDNSISALYFDRSGVLWIGTENGLDKYDPFKNQYKIKKNFLGEAAIQLPRISGYAETFDHKLLIATHNYGLFIEQGSYFKLLADRFKEISGIYTQDGKIFYCGLWDGKVLIYNYLNKSTKLLDLGFDPEPVFAFAPLNDSRLLIGSHGSGAVIYNPLNKNIDHQLQRLFPDLEINDVIADKNGIIWLASETGVVQYDIEKNEVKRFNADAETTSGISNDYAKDICIDELGTLWLTTTLGLNYFDEEKQDFVPVYDPPEVHNNWITDILTGPDGYLWLNLNNGKVGKFNPKNSELNVYDVGSGNRLDIFSNKGFLLFNDSIIYLTGKDGVISFPVKGLKDNMVSEPPFITEVKIQNKVVLPGDTINRQILMKEDLNFSKKLELAYANRNFSFTFSSPSYVNNKLNKFQYMLEGYDEEWITTDGVLANVQYTNLYPREYQFKIRASNSSGYWSEESVYQIKINPPFWLTFKAILLVFTVLSITLFLVYRQLKKSIELRQQLQFQKVQHENDERLNDEKLRFFTNISHELRTPISLILGPAKQLADEGGANEYQKNRLSLILQNSNRLLYLVNQLLDFRKSQSGQLQLKVAKTDILAYTKNAFQSFEEYAKDKKINYQFTCEEEITGWIDRDKYDKIIFNLLSNAIKFTHKNGHVDLYASVSGDENNIRQLKIEVSDDGVGIPLESQKKIFNRFYQVEDSKQENTGSGIGLSLVQSLVEVHKASIEVQSVPDRGSVFYVIIPIDRECYSDDEVFDYELKSSDASEVQVSENKMDSKSIELKEKILLVEDNTELRKYAAEYLSEFYKVYEAKNGEEGLRICIQEKPILCVVDVMMPVMDGFEFCTHLKSDERISHIPVILLTALSDHDNMIKGYKLGADAYLAKPFDPPLLKTRIENIVKNRVDLKEKFSQDVESDIQILAHSPVDEEFILKVKDVIEKNISNTQLTGDLICSEMAISSSTLYRRIKELTDLSPNEFIRTIRLKKSVELLKQKRNNVSEVSTMVGFNDPYYFSRCFRKQFGFPPSNLL